MEKTESDLSATAFKVPTYRAGDEVLCKGVVERSEHDDSVYVRFAASRECPQLRAADIAELVQPSIKVGDRVQWWVERGNVTGEIIAINRDVNLGVGKPKTWLWIAEDGKWPRVTIDAAKVTRI